MAQILRAVHFDRLCVYGISSVFAFLNRRLTIGLYFASIAFLPVGYPAVCYADDNQDKLQLEVLRNLNRYADWRDEIRERYFVYGVGEMVAQTRGGIENHHLSRGFRTQCEAEDFTYAAMCNHRQHDTSKNPRPAWSERVRCNNTTLVRSTGKPLPKDYINFSAKRPLGAYSPRPYYNFDPLETIYGLAENFPAARESRNSMEKLFKARGTVKKVGRESNGDLRANFEYRAGQLRGKFDVLQSKNLDYLPTFIRFTIEDHPYADRYFSEVKIDWERKGDRWVPHRLSTAYVVFGEGPEILQRVFKLQWFIGDEVPDYMFECGSEDYRQRFERFLDVKFSEADQYQLIYPGDPIVLPADLYRDDARVRPKPTTP